MAQFVAFSPNVEVSGQSMQITIEAMGNRVFPLLQHHGMTKIEPDKWYPQQPYLDFFREVASGDFSSVLDLVSIGLKVPELAFWPPEIDTIEDALFSIDQAYQLNHRGGEIGSYTATQTGPREIEIYCENPYPCDFDYGTVYGTAKRYLPQDGTLKVRHSDRCCRKKGDDACLLVVSW